MSSIIIQLTNASNSEKSEFMNIFVPRPLYFTLSKLIFDDTEVVDKADQNLLE